MYKNNQVKWVLAILILIIVILSFDLILVKNKFIVYKNNKVANSVKKKDVKIVQQYGYSDILECLSKNKDFEVESINMTENRKCSVEVNYKGDMKLLYSSLSKLNESKNFLKINKIILNKDSKISRIGIDFEKNK